MCILIQGEGGGLEILPSTVRRIRPSSLFPLEFRRKINQLVKMVGNVNKLYRKNEGRVKNAHTHDRMGTTKQSRF